MASSLGLVPAPTNSATPGPVASTTASPSNSPWAVLGSTTQAAAVDLLPVVIGFAVAFGITALLLAAVFAKLLFFGPTVCCPIRTSKALAVTYKPRHLAHRDTSATHIASWGIQVPNRNPTQLPVESISHHAA